MINQIVPCPKKISETGYIRIVGDATKAPANPHSNYRWDYKALSYDHIKECSVGSVFDVSKEEVERWISADMAELMLRSGAENS